MEYLSRYLYEQGITDAFAPVLVLVFILLAAAALLLRVVIFIGYGARYGSFKLNSKDLKSKSEILSLKNGITARIAKDYAHSCERGAAHTGAMAITKRHLLNQRLIYWTFDSISRFITGIEAAIPFLGIILILSFNNPGFFAILTFIIFAVTRVVAATCDYEHTYASLESEITTYLEREVGRFYILDTRTGLTKLNKTMLDAAARQASETDTSIARLSENLSGALKLTVGEMQKNIEDTVRIINSYGDVLRKPLNEWNAAVTNAAKTQDRINEAAANLKTASDFAAANFKEYLTNKTSLDNALGYIEDNQAALRESLDRYELALEQMTVRLGDALGSILNHHIEGAYANLNTQLSENIDKILCSNQGLQDAMQSLFAEMTEHMKALFQAVVNFKEM